MNSNRFFLFAFLLWQPRGFYLGERLPPNLWVHSESAECKTGNNEANLALLLPICPAARPLRAGVFETNATADFLVAEANQFRFWM